MVDLDPLREQEKLLNVPWLEPYYWCSKELVGSNVSAGSFPDCVPVRELDFPECDLRFIVPVRDTVRLPGESLQRARTKLIRLLHKRLRRVRTGH